MTAGPDAQQLHREHPGAQPPGGHSGPRPGGATQCVFRRPGGHRSRGRGGLYHDASEILTGDLPTPIKYYNPDIRDAYKQVEAIACRKLTGMLPEKLRSLYADLLTPADPQVEELVKAADKLSAHIKCLEEEKAGNHEFCAAARQTRQALADMHLPEVDLF